MQDNIVFFGTETFSVAALRALVEAGYHIAAVVTKPDRPFGRGMKLQAPVVKTYALEHGIIVLQPERLSDIDQALSAIARPLGVLSSYGKIIPESTLALFERGIINIHPSLLPKYRGPTPIETALINGDAQTGVSLMRLVAAMDAGPVYVQKPLAITPGASATDLYTLCAQTGSQLLIDSLPAIASGELAPTKQDETAATYTQLLNKKDARVDPERQTAEFIDRHVRAYEQFPRTRLELGGHDVIITKAHVGAPESGTLTIKCADNTWLHIDQLIVPSGKSMSGADFQRGYGA